MAHIFTYKDALIHVSYGTHIHLQRCSMTTFSWLQPGNLVAHTQCLLSRNELISSQVRHLLHLGRGKTFLDKMPWLEAYAQSGIQTPQPSDYKSRARTTTPQCSLILLHCIFEFTWQCKPSFQSHGCQGCQQATTLGPES